MGEMEKWKRQQLMKEEEDKWNREIEAQRVKRIKQQAEDEEKWAKEWEREKQLRMKQREADAAAWRQQLEAEEKRRKEEEERRRKEEDERVRKQEEAVLLQQQKLSFSSLPVKETKTVLFEKIVCGSALQQSLMLKKKQQSFSHFYALWNSREEWLSGEKPWLVLFRRVDNPPRKDLRDTTIVCRHY